MEYGLGSPISIPRIVDEFDGSKALVWVDSTNGTGNPSADSIIARVTGGFSATQLAGIKKLANTSDIPLACPQNFDEVSECFAAVVFNNIPAAEDDIESISYTLQSDGSRAHIDVVRHIGDFEQQILPLQWAVDQVGLSKQRHSSNLTIGVGYYRASHRHPSSDASGVTVQQIN
jgi:ATP-binding cassette subfamily A (ABC1) protein 3